MTNFLSFPRLFSILLWLAGGLVILFLIAPIVAIVPLSFNAEPFFTYPMPGLSLRWYREFFDSNVWQLALKNSIIVAVFATLLSTLLGALSRDRPQPTLMPGTRNADRHSDFADDRAGYRFGSRHLLCRRRMAAATRRTPEDCPSRLVGEFEHADRALRNRKADEPDRDLRRLCLPRGSGRHRRAGFVRPRTDD